LKVRRLRGGDGKRVFGRRSRASPQRLRAAGECFQDARVAGVDRAIKKKQTKKKGGGDERNHTFATRTLHHIRGTGTLEKTKMSERREKKKGLSKEIKKKKNGRKRG